MKNDKILWTPDDLKGIDFSKDIGFPGVLKRLKSNFNRFKTRDVLEVSKDMPDDDLRVLALWEEKRYLDRPPKRIIVVPGRVVNIVV